MQTFLKDVDTRAVIIWKYSLSKNWSNCVLIYFHVGRRTNCRFRFIRWCCNTSNTKTEETLTADVFTSVPGESPFTSLLHLRSSLCQQEEYNSSWASQPETWLTGMLDTYWVLMVSLSPIIINYHEDQMWCFSYCKLAEVKSRSWQLTFMRHISTWKKER
jgi:hypothetical protein